MTDAAASSSSSLSTSWINGTYFTEFLQQHMENFKELQSFTLTSATKGGENYASNIMRIKMVVSLDDDSTETLSYILKIPLPTGESETVDSLWSLFPKETLMYRKILPRFEKLYRDNGVNITFAPKYYALPPNDSMDDNVLLLEDLSQRGFGLQNRLEGLNLKYTECVLEKLAAFHAASARYVEVYGTYEPMFEQHMFSEETRPLYENVKINYFYDYAKAYKDHEEYIDLLPNVLDNYLDKCIAASSIDFGEFNVLNHGDFWLNNVLFRNGAENQMLETYFIDFQLCKYGSPTLDLYLFLLSGTSLAIKIPYFDYFIKFYHDNLLKYLQILKYNGKPPTLQELQLMLLKYGYMAFASVFNCLSVCLYEPKNEAECNLDCLMNDSPEAVEYRKSLFLNERFKSHAEVILPWLANRGLLE